MNAFRFAVVGTLLLSVGASAETEAEKKARAEIEAQLKQLVKSDPGKVRVTYNHFGELNVALTEVTFTLDGAPLKTPGVRDLSDEGKHLVYEGEVSNGQHSLQAHFTFANRTSAVMSDEGGLVWKPIVTRSFTARTGLVVDVVFNASYDKAEKDPTKRVSVGSTAEAKMTGPLEDGTMPVVAKAPAPAVVDAGVAEKTESPAEKKQRLAAEAQEAKKVAAEAAAEKKRLAAEEKLAKAEAAKEAAAARKAEASARTVEASAKKAGPGDVRPEKPAATPPEAAAVAPAAPVDAGAVAEAEVPDAGAPEVVAVAPAQPSVPEAAPPPPESGFPMPVLIGAGILVLGIIVVLATRKKQGPPTDGA